MILAGWHYDNSVDTIAAAARYEHLHLDTSRAAHLRAIELAVREIGAERILLGTGAPLRAIQSSLNAILAARIPDDRKRAILGGNAARLFGLPVPPIALPPVWKPARNIDVHTHSGPLPWDIADLPDDQLVAELAGRRTPPTPLPRASSPSPPTSEAGNREMVEGAGRSTAASATSWPIRTTSKRLATTSARWGDAPGIVGAKVHCQWSHNLTGFGEHLGAVQGPRRLRQARQDPQRRRHWDQHLLRIAREHPRLPIVIAHGGLGFPDLPGASWPATADNVYLEMCSSFAQIPTVREIVRIVPRHKFLFGTDAPLLDPSFVLGTYQDA